ncbi:hypothetical protein HDV00_006334 [Rhizophlyctis rosea]|nr:hypothetical protein HDV00_006334 [Rhizophlyctis rosea]
MSPGKHKNVFAASIRFKCTTRTSFKIGKTTYYSELKIVDEKWALLDPPQGPDTRAKTDVKATGSSRLPPLAPNGFIELPVLINLGSETTPYLPNTVSGMFTAEYALTAEALVPRQQSQPQSFTAPMRPHLKSAIYPPIPAPIEMKWTNGVLKDCPFTMDLTLPQGICLQVGVPFNIQMRLVPNNPNSNTKKVQSVKLRVKQYTVVYAGSKSTWSRNVILNSEVSSFNAQGRSFENLQSWQLTIPPASKWKESMEVRQMTEVFHKLKVSVVVDGLWKKRTFGVKVRVVRPVDAEMGSVTCERRTGMFS